MKRLLCLLVLCLPFISSTAHSRNWQTDSEFRERLLSDPKRCQRAVRNKANYLKYWPSNYSVEPIAYAPKAHVFHTYEAFGDLSYSGCPAAAMLPNKMDAAIWYERAAVGHLAVAQFKLGRMLYEGDGIQEDRELGLQWLTSAALEKSESARQYLVHLGVDIQPSAGPTTYQQMEQEYRNMAAAQRQAAFSDAVNFVAAVATVYLEAQVAQNPAPSVQRQAPVQYVRPRPTYCTTSSFATVTSTDSLAIINATRQTFCN